MSDKEELFILLVLIPLDVRNNVLLDGLSDQTLKTIYCDKINIKIAEVICDGMTIWTKDQLPVRKCKEPPTLNEICQQYGQLFVTTDATNCEFKDGRFYFPTSRCTGISWFLFGFVQYDNRVLILSWWRQQLVLIQKNNWVNWQYTVASVHKIV